MRRQSGVELRFRAAFVQNPCVVESLIGVVEPLEGLLRFPVTIVRTAGELIRKGEPQQTQCELMLRFDVQNIATDRLCFFRFVKGTVEFRLRDGLWDSRCRNTFELIFLAHTRPSRLSSRRESCGQA